MNWLKAALVLDLLGGNQVSIVYVPHSIWTDDWHCARCGNELCKECGRCYNRRCINYEACSHRKW